MTYTATLSPSQPTKKWKCLACFKLQYTLPRVLTVPSLGLIELTDSTTLCFQSRHLVLPHSSELLIVTETLLRGSFTARNCTARYITSNHAGSTYVLNAAEKSRFIEARKNSTKSEPNRTEPKQHKQKKFPL